MFTHGETVEILTAGTVADPYSGETQPDWDAATSKRISGVGVEPRPSSEPTQDARNAVTSGFSLYLPTCAPVTRLNRVKVRGEVYDVMGDPAEWVNPFTGWAPGQVVQVERTKG